MVEVSEEGVASEDQELEVSQGVGAVEDGSADHHHPRGTHGEDPGTAGEVLPTTHTEGDMDEVQAMVDLG